MFSLSATLRLVLIASCFLPSTEYSITINSGEHLPIGICFKPRKPDRNFFRVTGIPFHRMPRSMLTASSGCSNDHDNDDIYQIGRKSSTLVSKFNGVEKYFSPQEISDTLFNIQGDQSNPTAIRALILNTISCNGSFTAEEVGNALYGLRGMTDDCPEVLELLSVLLPKFVSSNLEMNSTSLGMSFIGLQGIRGDSKVSALLDFLYRQVDTMVNSTNQLQDLSCENLLNLGMQMALSTAELLEAFDDKHPKWEKINLVIVDEIARRKSIGGLVFTDTDMQSSSVFKTSLGYQYITLSSNFNFFGPYDCETLSNRDGNVLCQIRATGTDTDTPAALLGGGSNIRFCMSRDRHLSMNHIGIEPVGAKFLRKVERTEFERWLVNRSIGAKIWVEADHA